MPAVQSVFVMAQISKTALHASRLLMAVVGITLGLVGLALIGGAIVKPSREIGISVLIQLLIWAVAAALLIAFDRASRNVAEIRFEIRANTLLIGSRLYGRELPRETLKLEEARLIDFLVEPGFRPGLSATGPMGLNLFGSCLGAFRLLNGQRAILFLVYPTSKPVVWLPTTSGLPLLISPDDPSGFLEALRGVQ